MKARGIKPDDIICYSTYNERDSFAAYIASFLIGAVASSISPLLPPDEIVHLLPQLSPVMIFCTPSFKLQMEKYVQDLELESDIISLELKNDTKSLAAFLKNTLYEKDFQPYQVTDVNKTAAIFCSSGTTGLPKVTCVSHKCIIHRMLLHG